MGWQTLDEVQRPPSLNRGINNGNNRSLRYRQR